MTVSEIAQLTGYTPRFIRKQCAQGLLRATFALKGHRPEYHITREDYRMWNQSRKSKPARKPTTNQMKWLRLVEMAFASDDDKKEFIFSLFGKEQWRSISAFVDLPDEDVSRVTINAAGLSALRDFHETP